MRNKIFSMFLKVLTIFFGGKTSSFSTPSEGTTKSGTGNQVNQEGNI